MASHQGRLYHCGAVAPKRSTFADANRARDFRVFSGLFEAMLAQAGRGFRRKMADAVRLIDSTGLRLAGDRGGMGALLDLGLRGQDACRLRSRPRAPGLSRRDRRQRQRHHRRQGRCRSKRARPMCSTSAITTSASWAKLDALGCRLVTRFKTNTPLNEPREMPLEPGSTVLSDRIGFLPARQAMNRKNPMQDAVREIVVKTETGETLRLAHQRSRRAGAGDRRPLQAPLANRVVLPADEADAQDHEVRRTIGKRRAHPDRRGADRLSSAARPATGRQRRPRLPRARSTCAHQPHASKRPDPTPKSPASPAARLAPTPTLLHLNLNRTAVGLTRLPTRFRRGERPQRTRDQESVFSETLVNHPQRCRDSPRGGAAWMAGSSPGQARPRRQSLQSESDATEQQITL